ncbi:AFG2-interacting ribosome maturation factor [Sardina pilchardus]|uniref:AFG2-interacting ribosome maturation factor n=1 Tax=Sardina pilchardus TaxID=27697 RepID=UPI002E143579
MAQMCVASCHQKLKQCFQTLENNHKAWNLVQNECTPLISSLGNLGEQLIALDNVQLNVTPLQRFPDLQERLRIKLLQAVDVVLGKLADKLDELQRLLKTMDNQVSTVFQFYEQNTATLDLATCTMRSSTSPSIADMLEWLQDANSYHRQQFLRRKYLLQVLTPDDLSLLQEVPKRWESVDSPDGDEHISDTLLRVSLFVDS